MKLCTFTHGGATRVGAIDADEVVDLSAIARDMIGFLSKGKPALDAAAAALDRPGPRLALADVRLEAPVRRPPEFLALGLNYADHIKEAGLETPKFPLFFNKQSACTTGPYDPIHLPRVSNKLDYEGELGFVIGTRCRHVPKERAREVVAGFIVVDDVSVRDWQFKAPTWTLGKSFDTHGPTGPWIVTADELDPHGLDLWTWVNGEQRQHSNTREFIFDCWDMVATLSTVFTLEPGVIVSTGTPSGIGGPLKKYLKVGDVVRIEIEGIGVIENRVIDEPDDTQLPRP